MNQWKTQVTYSRRYSLIFYSVPVLVLLAMISQEPLLFSIAILFVLFIAVNKYYLSYTAKKIAVSDEENVQVLKLFPGDDGAVKIPFENRGRLPVFNSELNLVIYDLEEAVTVKNIERLNSEQANYTAPFSIPSRIRRPFSVELTAKKRGVVQIRSLKIIVRDLLNLNKMTLEYKGRYRGEAIVYPAPLPIPGLEKVSNQQKGNQHAAFSMYEDVMLTRGNRDYISSDPFNRINWKASARKDNLQTKVYEKVTLSKWTFVINVRHPDPHRVTIENLEEVLSQAAYACQVASKQNITFEMYINIRVPGETSGLNLSPGQGMEHLTRALEILARIRRLEFTIPSGHMLYRLVNQPEKPQLILHFGKYGEEEKKEYEKLTRLGSKMVLVAEQSSEQETTGNARRADSEKIAN